MLSVAVSKLNSETDTDHVAYEGANLCTCVDSFFKSNFKSTEESNLTKIVNYKSTYNYLKNEIKFK